MVQKVAERGREPEPQENLSEMSRRRAAEYRRQRAEGAVVVRARDISWEQNPQGYHQFLSHVKVWTGQAVPYWSIFVHIIRTHSGKHVHQGGLGIFVLDGKGYTVVDGVRYDWEKDDLILLPVKPGGCEHQHFNLDPDKPAVWLAFIFNVYRDAMADATTQKEISPDWKGPMPLPHVA